MREMNVICGLPRSGSTLLCNILNQNPAFWATSTSVLPNIVANVVSTWSNSVEVKGELERDKEGTEQRLRDSLKSFCYAWHRREDDREIVFDKSRGWTSQILALRGLFPEAKVLVTVRDLRNVFASIEKRHRDFPLLDEAGNLLQKSIFNRADNMFSPQGMIGGCIEGILDIHRRKLPVKFVKFEDLTANPATTLGDIYDYLGEPMYSHDFDNVENTATDPDGFYNHKYPHQGSGKVQPTNVYEWQNYMNNELAATIMDRFQQFNAIFNYR